MAHRYIIAALPLTKTLTAVESAGQVARAMRLADRTIAQDAIVQWPLVSGGRGTLEALVTKTLGSFLEVEATGADGKQTIVPIGFVGDEGKMAVIEMSRVAGVDQAGTIGTTAGIGELIQDVLDEGAFSVLLGSEEPMAMDAGMGIGAALGVKFYDAKDQAIAIDKEPGRINDIARIDASGRSFQLLSSRFFVANSNSATDNKPGKEWAKLIAILKRDCGLNVPASVSASGIELGLAAFLNAEFKDGAELCLEASELAKDIGGSAGVAVILVVERPEVLNTVRVAPLLKIDGEAPVILLTGAPVTESERTEIMARHPQIVALISLQDAQLFAAPLTANAREQEITKDAIVRLEKIAPKLLAACHTAVA